MIVYTAVDEYLGHDTEFSDDLSEFNLTSNLEKHYFANKEVNCDIKINKNKLSIYDIIQNNRSSDFLYNNISYIKNHENSRFEIGLTKNTNNFEKIEISKYDEFSKKAGLKKPHKQNLINNSFKHFTFSEIRNIDPSQIHLLNLPQNCKCIKALHLRLQKLNNIDVLSSLPPIALLKKINDSSIPTKFKILDIFLQYKNPPLNIPCLYKKQFLKYLGKFHLKNKIPLSDKNLLNNNLYFDYCFTIEDEENRRLIDFDKIFCQYDENVVDKILLIYNLSKSVYLMRTMFINYPVIEYLIIVLNAFCTKTENFVEKNRFMNENYDTKKANSKLSFNKRINENIICIDKNIILQTLSDFRFYENINIESTILKTLSNLVLDYGNFKKKLIHLNGLSKVNKFMKLCPLDVLTFYKNFFYTQTHIRLDDSFFSYYFDHFFSSYSLIFKLIRNISNNKISISCFLKEKIIEYFLKVEDLDLIYCVSNLLSYDDKFKDDILRHEIFAKLIQLFKNKELYQPLVWFVINLSWKDECSKKRVEFINKYRIKEILIDIKEGGLIDKVETAIDQLK